MKYEWIYGKAGRGAGDSRWFCMGTGDADPVGWNRCLSDNTDRIPDLAESGVCDQEYTE